MIMIQHIQHAYIKMAFPLSFGTERKQQGLFLALSVTLVDQLDFTALALFRGHKIILAPSLRPKRSVTIRYKHI